MDQIGSGEDQRGADGNGDGVEDIKDGKRRTENREDNVIREQVL